MHGSPFSKYDNKKIWEKYDYRDYGIIAEPSFDIDYDEVFYITDTGRSWNNSKVSVRDKVVRTDVRGLRLEAGASRLEVSQKMNIEHRTSNIERRIKNNYGAEEQRSPVKSSFGGLPMAAFNGASRNHRFRDKLKTKFDIKIKNTHDLIEKIQNNELPDKIMMNVHPQRWNDEFIPWASELVGQNFKNVLKRLIVHRRDAENAKERDIFLSAERPERKKIPFKNLITLT
jgi:hypothetical protein